MAILSVFLQGKFSRFHYQGSIQAPTDIFCWNFMLICPVTKKCDFTEPVRETSSFFCCHSAPLWPRVPKFQQVRSEFRLHMTVKFYPDPLRFARVIHEKPILSNYIVRCVHAVHESVQQTTNLVNYCGGARTRHCSVVDEPTGLHPHHPTADHSQSDSTRVQSLYYHTNTGRQIHSSL